jgi:branched-chain amino acid transport system ATP-binding protein
MISEPVVEVRDLTHAFGGQRVLDDVAFRVDASPGQPALSLCIIGPNGAGKTTLLDVLSGFLKPDPRATVNVLGKTIHGSGPEALALRGVARTFQGALDVVPELSVLANLSLVSSITSVPWWKRLIRLRWWRGLEMGMRRDIEHALAETGCEELVPKLEEPAGTLSFGWRRVVSALRVHLSGSRLILLDEPFAGLDLVKLRLVQHLISIWRKEGRTVIFVEHIRSSAMRSVIETTAERMLVLDRGRILLDGPPAEVLGDWRFVRAYTGTGKPSAAKARRVSGAACRYDHARSVLQFRGIKASYNGMPVLRGIDATVREGSHVLVVGPNGAGKSTLLGTVHRIGEQVEGEVLLGTSTVLSSLPAFEVARRGVGFVPQRDRVFSDRTVARNLAAAASGLKRHLRRARIQEVLTLFPALASRLGQVAGTLSDGEQTQLALALALVRHPNVLLADEISIGLDHSSSRNVLNLLRKRVEEGMALATAEQVYQTALELCDWVLALRDGRVFWEGPPEEFNEDIQVRLFSGLEITAKMQ